MYRIMCNSLKNYATDFDNDISNPRYKPVYFLGLMGDVEKYNLEKNENSHDYQKLSNFLWHIRHCPNSEQILYELNMLGIEGEPPQEHFDFSETNRIWQMFLKKAYWRD